MREFTYSEARQKFAALLEKALREGGVRIRRRDGQVFELTPAVRNESPLDVPAAVRGVSRKDILRAIAEGRPQY